MRKDSYDVNGVILPFDENECAPDNINQDFGHFGANPDSLKKDSNPATGN